MPDQGCMIWMDLVTTRERFELYQPVVSSAMRTMYLSAVSGCPHVHTKPFTLAILDDTGPTLFSVA